MCKLAPLKNQALIMSILKAADEAGKLRRNEKLQVFLESFSGQSVNDIISCTNSSFEEIFLADLTWACFSTYRSVLIISTIQIKALSATLNSSDIPIDIGKINNAIKQILPHRSNYIDQCPNVAAYHLVEELEKSVLQELKKELCGNEADAADIRRASAMLESVKAVDIDRSRVTATATDLSKS